MFWKDTIVLVAEKVNQSILRLPKAQHCWLTKLAWKMMNRNVDSGSIYRSSFGSVL
jgi:hypothetical protein